MKSESWQGVLALHWGRASSHLDGDFCWHPLGTKDPLKINKTMPIIQTLPPTLLEVRTPLEFKNRHANHSDTDLKVSQTKPKSSKHRRSVVGIADLWLTSMLHSYLLGLRATQKPEHPGSKRNAIRNFLCSWQVVCRLVLFKVSSWGPKQEVVFFKMPPISGVTPRKPPKSRPPKRGFPQKHRDPSHRGPWHGGSAAEAFSRGPSLGAWGRLGSEGRVVSPIFCVVLKASLQDRPQEKRKTQKQTQKQTKKQTHFSFGALKERHLKQTQKEGHLQSLGLSLRDSQRSPHVFFCFFFCVCVCVCVCLFSLGAPKGGETQSTPQEKTAPYGGLDWWLPNQVPGS